MVRFPPHQGSHLHFVLAENHPGLSTEALREDRALTQLVIQASQALRDGENARVPD